MKDRILQLLGSQDSFAAIEFAFADADALAAVIALDELMRDLYWKQKDLTSAVAFGRAAAQHALISAAAITSSHPELPAILRGKAKSICYNLASFTWRGWGEEGVSITPSDEAVGLDAARTNLRLAVELKKGDLPMSRAYWMLGGQQISKRDYSAALGSYRKAAEFARLAAEPGEESLAMGFVRLTEYLLAGCAKSRLDPIIHSYDALAKVKDGEAFVQQLSKALEIFGPQQEQIRT